MPRKKSLAKSLGTKAQAGLEYLITYGWALVAIATIIGVLVFAASGGVNTNTCTTFLSLVRKGIVADGDTLVMVLQNASGQKISITPFEDICFNGICGYAKIDYGGTIYQFENVEIGTGEQFKILGEGQVLASEMSITYTEGSTGLEKTVTSTIGTDAPDTTELSNDGIDNDGIGGIDCADPKVTGPCEYVVENGTPVPTSITDGGTSTITFTSPSMQSGAWFITGGTIRFNVTSGAGATAKAKIGTGGWSNWKPIKVGWNYIQMPSPGGLLATIEIQLEVANADVVISNDTDQKPKAIITLIVD